MAIGGFLQGLGLAYGNSLIQGVNFEEKKAQADLMKTEAQQAQMQTQQMQQEMQTRKSIGAFIQSQTQLEGADAANPLNQAKMYTKAAGLAASQGDLASAQEMSGLARQAQQDAIEQTKALAQQQAVKKEDLANTADALPDNPSQDQMADLVRKAVAAGVDPLTIPPPNTPALLTWKNQMKLAGMDSTQRAEYVQKAADFKLNQERLKQDHQDNVDLKKLQINTTATYREGMLQEHRDALAARTDKAPSVLDLGSAKYEFDPQGQIKGDRLSSDTRYVKLGDKVSTNQENNTVQTGKAAANVARDLSQMARFPTGTTASPFAHITDHDFLLSIEKVGSNALTPEQIQMFGSSRGAMSTELSRVLTIGAGRGANQSVINEIKQFTTPGPGDTNLTAAYKMSTAAQMVKTTMENTPPPADASVRKGWDATLATVSAFPTPDRILDAASGQQAKQLNNMQGTYNNLLNKVQDAVIKNNSSEGLPGTGDSGSGTNVPPLPAGFKVDQ
jgi:hypothetical protein